LRAVTIVEMTLNTIIAISRVLAPGTLAAAAMATQPIEQTAVEVSPAA
jgi:hypothetical protein